MKDQEPTMYGALVDKSVKDMRVLLKSMEADHPIETELARSDDPMAIYIANRMRTKRKAGHNMEYVFRLPPTAENLSILTRVEEYESKR